MDILLSIIIILASVLLTFLVFVQNPKGGGLSSDFGSAQQLGGVKKTNDFVVKGTWTLAGIIMVCSIFMTLRVKSDAPKKVEQTEQSGQTGDQGGQQQQPQQ